MVQVAIWGRFCATQMRLRVCVLALLVALLSTGCHRSETRPSTGRRVVTLMPSATEVVAALGATDRLVGVDRYSEYPEEVRHLPKVGDFMQPDVERILALTPDTVVLDAVQTGALAKLQAAGIKALPIRMEKIDDVPHALRQVGQALGVAGEGEAAALAFESRLASLRSEAIRRQAGRAAPRVLIIVDRRPGGGLGALYAAGPGTYLDEVIGFLGAKNALGGDVRYSRLAVDYVIALAPDVIVDVSPPAASGLADWNELPSVPAVRDHRVYALADATLQAPGPRTDLGAARLLPLVWP